MTSNNHWQTKKLEEIADFQKGKLMQNSSIKTVGATPYILIEDLRTNKFTHFTPSNNGTACVSNDTLLAWDGANAGTVGGGLNGFVGSTITKISPKDEVEPLYLRMFLSSKFKEFNKHTHGAAVPHLDKEFVLSYQVPLPPIAKQKEIVKKLDAIRKLQELNQKEIEKAKELFNSFLINNFKPKSGWQVKKLPDVAVVKRGKFTPRPRNDPKYFGGTIPWIQTGDITNSNGLITDYSQTLNDNGLAVSRVFPRGTIVVTIAANIGDFAVLGIDAAFPDSVVGITADEKIVNPQFLYFQLLQTKSYLDSQATQAAQKNINLQVLSTVNIYVPPIKVQLETVKRLEATKSFQETLLLEKTKLTELFESSLNKFMTISQT